MKKVFVVACALIFFTVLAFAEESRYTGADYLNLTKQQRLDMVTSFKKQCAKKGVTIQKTPVYYCKKLDAVYAKHPNMSEQPLSTTLKTLIIMEYDWNEMGVNKDTLARQWLGEDLYKANKERLSKR